MSLLDNVPDSGQQDPDDDEKDENVDFDADDDRDIPADLLTTMKYPGHSRPITNYFGIAKILQHREVGTVPVPLCSFVVEHTAFHLTYNPSIRNISVDDAAIKFGLPDLRPAIADFLHCEATHGRDHIHTSGGARRAGPTASLPFNKLQVWFKLRVQDTNFHDASIIRPAQTLNCAPSSDPCTHGRYDTVIINNEARPCTKGRTDSKGLGFSSCAVPLTRVCALNFRMKSGESPVKSGGLLEEHGKLWKDFPDECENFQMSAGKFRRNFRKLGGMVEQRSRGAEEQRSRGAEEQRSRGAEEWSSSLGNASLGLRWILTKLED
ncbi:uncharacterized protein HD556DRAFT_1440611 [Suillus plorans]|uniref:DUF6830 domain-containing protein n=1 Tax=Suillus plorans TaxID=116603 RepID=A0A9P7J0F8_9AGAM|nr:uncharacterized protein HD556DRAFT_1440611 [Suillus plorans]KAG1798271.1 hypothetical protein HD556DRAFT_1440611 [Suillus plorans]